MSEAQKTVNVNGLELNPMAEPATRVPVACRQAFTLREVYGYSGREIANRLRMPGRAAEELLIQAARVCAKTHDLDVQGLGRSPSLLKRLRSQSLTND
jgi:DNA-directed RNA polymerase specialized sigma24 family protein